MEAERPDAFALAAEPTRLRAFVDDLEAEGFEQTGPFTWEGPTHQSLLDGGHTDAQLMTIIIRPSWPYLPPLIHVPGIATWHADQERLCLWQSEDASQRWTTLRGLYDRIEEWAGDADRGFIEVENARNPEIYWQEEISRTIGLVEIDTLLGGQPSDGQHGDFHFTDAVSPDGRVSPVTVYELHAGPFTAMTDLPGGLEERRTVRAHWFYRESVPHPPRNLDEFRDFLTDRQRKRLQGDLANHPVLMFGLFWRNAAGLVATVLLSSPGEDGEAQERCLVVLRPNGVDELLLRAGPDAAILAGQSVAVLGAGAIGSHVAEQLARAGVRTLKLYDSDRLWPANLIRHAAVPGTPAATAKTTALKHQLEQYPWVQVQVPERLEEGHVWTIHGLRAIVDSADLTIDATGHGGLAELGGRVAREAASSYLTVALFRGGSVARVRRQAIHDDTPIVDRPRRSDYPTIPPLDEEVEYVGTETGCLARVHNAPPVSVAQAAAVAVNVAIDHLTGRHDQPDEVIEVIQLGEEPFNRLGRLRVEDLAVTVDISESVQRTIRTASLRARPSETGGVLVGCRIDGRTVVAEAIEVPDDGAGPHRFSIGEGRVQEVVGEAQGRDQRLGYVGEWHSHLDNEAGPSMLDVATMLTVVGEPDVPDRPVLIIAHPGMAAGEDLRVSVATTTGLKEADVCTTGDLPPPTDEAEA